MALRDPGGMQMFGVAATLSVPETLEKLAQQAPAVEHFVVPSQPIVRSAIVSPAKNLPFRLSDAYTAYTNIVKPMTVLI